MINRAHGANVGDEVYLVRGDNLMLDTNSAVVGGRQTLVPADVYFI